MVFRACVSAAAECFYFTCLELKAAKAEASNSVVTLLPHCDAVSTIITITVSEALVLQFTAPGIIISMISGSAW